MESLLRGSITLETDVECGLADLPLEAAGRTNQIIRHIIPERAIHPIELVHIIDYDQLKPEGTDDIPHLDKDGEPKEQSSSVSR